MRFATIFSGGCQKAGAGSRAINFMAHWPYGPGLATPLTATSSGLALQSRLIWPPRCWQWSGPMKATDFLLKPGQPS